MLFVKKSMLFNSPQVRKLLKGKRYLYFVLNQCLYGMQNIDNLRLKYFWSVTKCLMSQMSAKVTTGQIKIIWLCLEIKINVVFVMSLGQIVMNWLIDCSRIVRVQFIHPIIISYISSKSLIWHLFTKCKLIFLSRYCSEIF